MDHARFLEQENSAIVLQPGVTRLDDAERLLIIATLKRARYNRTRAAGLLGIGVRTLQRKLKQYREEAEVSVAVSRSHESLAAAL